MMTEREIQEQLYYRLRAGSSMIVPNCVPSRWAEADILRITRSGYFEEYEIKLSASDFRKDRQKEVDISFTEGELGWGKKQLKHDLLARGWVWGPKRFYFVMPLLLAEEVYDLIPKWAGLIGVCSWIKTFKRAPSLHRQRFDQADMSWIMANMCWRYWDLRNGSG